MLAQKIALENKELETLSRGKPLPYRDRGVFHTGPSPENH
jgi:hypothetical protein